MTARTIPVRVIARAMKDRGATVEECVERFNAHDFRSEIVTLERLLRVRQSTPAANAGPRKEIFLRSVRKSERVAWLPLAARLRAAIAAFAVLVAGTAVATAADPIGVVQDMGREIGIVTESEQERLQRFELRAVVLRVDADAGLLVLDEGADGERQVHVDGETALVGISRLTAIRPGMVLDVSGTIEDGRYVAARVQVLVGDDSDPTDDVVPQSTTGPHPDETPTAEDALPPAPSDGPGSIEGPSPNENLPGVPNPGTTPAPVPDLPIPVPTLPELPIEPPDDPLPNRPLPDLPLPDVPLPPLPLP